MIVCRQTLVSFCMYVLALEDSPCMYVHSCLYISVHVQVHESVCMYALHICMNPDIHILYACKYIRMQAGMHECVCIYGYIYACMIMCECV